MNFVNSLVLIVSLSISIPINAQDNHRLLDHFKEKKKLTYGLNNRHTIILHERATIYAGFIGIKFGNRLKHVITLNSTGFWVGNPARLSVLGRQPVEAQLNFIGLSEEYLFWKKKRWALSSYMHMGVGKGRFRSVTPDMNIVHTQWIYPLEMGLLTGYSPNPWLELRLGGGYRYTFNAGDWPLHSMYVKIGAGVNLRVLQSKLLQLSSKHKFIYAK
jgi:hypothetical protein